MRRRHVLTSLLAAVGLSGCAGQRPSSSTATPSSTETANVTGSPTETRPASVVVRSALRYVHNVDAIAVRPPSRDQFAFVAPPRIGTAPPPDAYTLELGDERFTPLSRIPGFTLHTPGVGEAYTEDKSGGWLVFDVSTVEAERGVLLRRDTRIPLPKESLSRFATVPAFEVRAVDVPDSVAPGGTVEVTVTVQNEGSRAGLFLAGIQRGGAFDTIDLRAGVGETATSSRLLAVRADAGGEEYVRFVSAGESTGFTVPVEEGEKNASG